MQMCQVEGHTEADCSWQPWQRDCILLFVFWVLRADIGRWQHIMAAAPHNFQCLLGSCTAFFAGYNVCIFAYGQTGSGKTHTMSGTNTVELSGRGINYRALDDLFAIRDKRVEEVRPRC